LQFWSEIAVFVFGDMRLVDFHMELSKRLKLSAKLQLLIALSLVDNNAESGSPLSQDCLKLLKTKLVEYTQQSKMEALEEYAIHKLAFIVQTSPEYKCEY